MRDYTNIPVEELDREINELRQEIQDLSASIAEDQQWTTEGYAFDPNLGGQSVDEVSRAMERKEYDLNCKRRQLAELEAEKATRYQL